MPFDYANRVKKIPPYLFAEIEEKIRIKQAQGVDIIDFGIGDPDLPTPKLIVDEIAKQLQDPENHNYPTSAGELETRKAVADWYKRRFGVDIEPQGEVCILLGSKEGLANLARAFVNPGDKVLVPDPAYPVYAQGAAMLCDAVAGPGPLAAQAQLLVRGHPARARPRGQDALRQLSEQPDRGGGHQGVPLRAVPLVRRDQHHHGYDNAYSEITFDDYVAPSMLEIGKEGTIEFGSLSKTFNMTGYRLGYAVGDAVLISGLKKVKSQIDSGAPKFIQKAAAMALEQYTGKEKPAIVKESLAIYEKRRNLLVAGLRGMGFKVPMPKGTFYLWFPIEGSSLKFADKMLEKGVVVTPGVGFGPAGEGYVRMALTQPLNRIEEALVRMKKAL